jgi:hypothetical protein
VLGRKNGRPKVLAYQASGDTSPSGPPPDPQQQWRSLFIDEIELPMLTDHPWQTADNYSTRSNCIDEIDIAIPD